MKRLPILALFFLHLLPVAARSQGIADKPTVIAESAYNVERVSYSSRLKVWWIVVLRNPYTDAFARRPSIIVTARDADGSVLATKDANFPGIPPGGAIAYSDDLDVEKAPAKIEFTPTKADYRPTATKPSDYKELEIKQLKLKDLDSGLPKVMGDMANPFGRPAHFIGAVLFRDESGKLIGGDSFQIHEIPAHMSLPFETMIFGGAIPPRYSKIEYLAFVGFLSDWEELVSQ